MDANRPVKVPGRLPRGRPTSAERRAAELASLEGRQAELKQQSAERRAKRDAAARLAPPPTPMPRRSNAR